MIKTLIFIKRLITAFFINIVFRPGKFLLRWFFYEVVVIFYQLFLFLAKKAGATGLQNKFLVLLDGKKSPHYLIIILIIIFVSINLTSKTQAVSTNETIGQTFLSELVASEISQNEQLIEEYFDEETEISPVQQTYLDNLSAIRVQPITETNAENQQAENDDIDQINLSQGGTALIKPEIAQTAKSKRVREDIIIYEIKPGDTVSSIAKEFEISINTILWENNLTAYSLIRPGEKLTILPQTGVIHKVASGESVASLAKKYKILEEEIYQANKLSNDVKLAIGQKLIMPGGSKIVHVAANSIAKTTAKNIAASRFAKPVKGEKLNWPTSGYRITQYYSWRHNAIDIADKIGTPIYATEAGIVEQVGWGTGYGNQIVINHGDGKKTRYAHLSRSYVRKGQEVGKGEAIAAMGSTGWSTGSHLHFEYIIYGVKQNPLKYLEY